MANCDELAGITTPAQLFAALRNCNVAGLLPRLGPNGKARIALEDLTVTEILEAAEWFGFEHPEEVFRNYRRRNPIRR